MNYQEALAFIHGTHQFSIKLGLENTLRLLSLMDSPQEALKYIHVAGTNGKGSTSNYLAEMLMAAGYKVGLYTSPFLEAFNERMRVNGKAISDDMLAEIASFCQEACQTMVEQGHPHPTEFEVVTAIGFEYFKRMGCDIVVLEVGMGGRLDATNVILSPEVAVITPVDLDHVEYLGDTIGKIAGEKAGIIKSGRPVIIHPQVDEALATIKEICQVRGSELIIAPTDCVEILEESTTGTLFSLGQEVYRIRMLGAHQTRNAAVALSAINQLNAQGRFAVSKEAIRSGLERANWAGRLEIMSHDPLVLIDGAHNLHGAKGLSSAIGHLLKGYKLIGVVGILGDKDVSGMLGEMLPHLDQIICTEADNPRRMTAQTLKERVALMGRDSVAIANLEEALQEGLRSLHQLTAEGEKAGLICFGSLYMIGGARGILRSKLQ